MQAVLDQFLRERFRENVGYIINWSSWTSFFELLVFMATMTFWLLLALSNIIPITIFLAHILSTVAGWCFCPGRVVPIVGGCTPSFSVLSAIGVIVAGMEARVVVSTQFPAALLFFAIFSLRLKRYNVR